MAVNADFAATVPWKGVLSKPDFFPANLASLDQSGAINGQVPVWNEGLKRWVAGTAGGGGGGAPSGPAGGDLAGTYPNPTLAVIGAGGGPIGDATHVAQLTFDTKGRVTGATAVLISAPGTGTVTSVAAGTGLSGSPNPIIAAGTISLANTAVAAATYGDATHVGRFTVDAQGRLTAASSVAITAGAGTVTSVTPGTGLTSTPNPIIGSGTIALANTAVTPSTYGDSTHVSQITVDQQGRITAASSVAISGAGAQEIYLSNYASLALADAAAVSAKAVLVVNQAVTIAASITVASPVRVTEGQFTINSAQILTFGGGLFAALTRIFLSTGTVQLNSATPAAYGEWWGAGLGNTSGDDAAPINAAWLACYNGSGSATFFFANRIYYLQGSLNLTHNIPIRSSMGATIQPSGSSPATNGIIVGAFDYNDEIWLPKISSFTGTGLRLYGTAVAKINLSLVVGCGANIEIYVDNTHQSCLDNNIICQFNANATVAAVQVTCLGSSPLVQGNYIYCNFINGCKRWFYKTSNGGNVPGNNVNANRYECDAIDFDLIANCTMIECDMIYSGSPVWIFGERFLVVSGFCGGAGASFLTLAGTFDGNDFDFGGSLPAVTYANMGGIEPSGGYGNRYLATWGAYEIGTIAATTSANTRSSWNAGTMSGRNRISCSFTLPGTFAAGSTADFYVYSPFVKGNSRLNLSGGGGSTLSNLGCLMTVLTDQNGTHDNEVRIQFMNVSGATISGGVLYGVLTVGIP